MSQIDFAIKCRAFKLTASNHQQAMEFINRFGIFMGGGAIQDVQGGIALQGTFFHDGVFVVIIAHVILPLSEADLGKLMHP